MTKNEDWDVVKKCRDCGDLMGKGEVRIEDETKVMSRGCGRNGCITLLIVSAGLCSLLS